VLLAIPWRIWLYKISDTTTMTCDNLGAGRGLVGIHIPNRTELAEEVEQFLCGDVEAINKSVGGFVQLHVGKLTSDSLRIELCEK
jgi:hypothetical protein